MKEIPLKQWRIDEAARLGISPSGVSARLDRGKYPHLKFRRVNSRTVFVILEKDIQQPAIGYPRDFSFYCRSHGGSAGKYHAMGDDLRSKCGRVRMLNPDEGRAISVVPSVLRCKVCWCAKVLE